MPLAASLRSRAILRETPPPFHSQCLAIACPFPPMEIEWTGGDRDYCCSQNLRPGSRASVGNLQTAPVQLGSGHPSSASLLGPPIHGVNPPSLILNSSSVVNLALLPPPAPQPQQQQQQQQAHTPPQDSASRQSGTSLQHGTSTHSQASPSPF